MKWLVETFKWKDDLALVKKLALEEIKRRRVSEISDSIEPVYRFFDHFGTPKYIENELARLRTLEDEDIHYVSLKDKATIEELQRLPKRGYANLS